MLVVAAQILARHQDHQRADEVANDFLTNETTTRSQRAEMHYLLARSAAGREDWTTAARHVRDQVTLLEPDVPRRVAWNLVDMQYRSGSPTAAWTTIQERQLSAEGDKARYWARIASEQPMTASVASQMIKLATESSDDPEFAARLLGHVISAARADGDEPARTSDRRPVLGVDLMVMAYEVLNDLLSRHDDGTLPVRQIVGDDPDDMIRQLGSVLRARNNEPLRDVLRMVSDDRLPAGMIGMASARPYGFVLCQRSVGHFFAGPASEESTERAKESVRRALGGDVVIDESAMLVAQLLESFDTARAPFGQLITPDAALRDIRATKSEAVRMSASVGSVVWDSENDAPVLIEADPEVQEAALRRLRLLESAAELAVGRPLSAIDVLPNSPVGSHGAWLGPLQTARDLALPLWSDDTALRLLAEHEQIETFGTLTSSSCCGTAPSPNSGKTPQGWQPRWNAPRS